MRVSSKTGIFFKASGCQRSGAFSMYIPVIGDDQLFGEKSAFPSKFPGSISAIRLTAVYGPGKIILQSMPISSTAMKLYEYMPHPSSN